MKDSKPDEFFDEPESALSETDRRLDPLETPVPTMVLGVLIAAAISGIDFCSYYYNMSIVYSVPMAMCARGTRRPSRVWVVAGILSALAYAGYLLGPWPPATPTWRDMLTSYRLWNRTIAAISVIAIAAIYHYEFNFRKRLGRYRTDPWRLVDVDRELFLEVINSFDEFRSLAVTLLVVACVAFADAIGPAPLNIAIAYAVPVLICARAQSRRLLWLTVALGVSLTWLGYVTNRPIDPLTGRVVANAWLNRTITGGVIVLMGMLVHIWIGSARPLTHRWRFRKNGSDGGSSPPAQTGDLR